jgi:cation diffusion facilitator CzcD-associated flavoprotein CzcO
MEIERLDVLIVGAGLSGIGAACHLRRRCPDLRLAVVEARAASGGTWDLFRFPGVRSDSDMYTLGYAFRPWRDGRAIAPGPSILSYLRDTAREHGIDPLIRYRHRVRRAAWSSSQAHWHVEIDVERDDAPPARLRVACAFLLMCSGYYDYAAAHAPSFPGLADYAGRVVHPQFWTDDIAWAGRRVVVIGSGATAMTLVPALAGSARHVTMLQRSPTWVVARPSIDPLAQHLEGWLPWRCVHAITRWKQVLLSQYIFALARRRPQKLRALLLAGVRQCLGPGRETEVERDFTPRYDPWWQRLCLLPDGDLFVALREGRAEVVTGEIDRFTPRGIALRSGRHLDADLVVTATGLEMKLLGGAELTVDGRVVDPATAYSYKGTMLSGVPNLAGVFGYTNTSWTLKADLAAEWVCRLLRHMRRRGHRQCVAHIDASERCERPWVDLTSGYVQRAIPRLPKQGAHPPWRLSQSYLRDIAVLRYGRIDDGVLQFDAPREPAPAAAGRGLRSGSAPR